MLSQCASQWEARPGAQQGIHHHIGFAHQALEAAPFFALPSEHNIQPPFLHQAEILVFGGVTGFEQIARHVSTGLGQIARRNQAITAVVARPYQDQYLPAPHLPSHGDGFGYRAPGLLHHRSIRVTRRIRGSLNTAHLLNSDNLHRSPSTNQRSNQPNTRR